MKIYVLGNPSLDEDSLPLKMLGDLRKNFPQINFQIVDPNEDFPPANERDLVILDTVINIKKPILLDLKDFEIKKKNPISPHDYDLLLHLLLLKKMKKIDQVTIIGVPKGRKKKILFKLIELINELLLIPRLHSG